MEVIDVIKKKQNKEKGYFKFYVASDDFCSKENCINWSYDNGEITAYDDNDFYSFLKDDVYSLYNEVRIIEEDKEIEELNLDYYHDEPANIDDLAYKVNELIKAVNELKKGK